MRFPYVLMQCCLLAGTVVLTTSSAAQSPSDAQVQDKFVGAWQLVSIETVKANGDVIYPFYGKHPQGLIVYAKNGWMSVQIVSDPAPTVPTADSREDFKAAPDKEKVAAAEGYYAYYGTWSVDPTKSTVTHHIKQSLMPGERGENGVRHFVFDGDRLILTAKTHEMGEEHERRLVWQRATPDKP